MDNKINNNERNKILGNLSDEIHTEVMIIKATHKFKSVEDTLKFLVGVYKRDKIRRELEAKEREKSHIKNIDNPQN